MRRSPSTSNACAVIVAEAVELSRGLFITVEGIEGVGKSTNIDVMRETIEARGLEVLTSREPGGTPMAEQIRGLLLDHGDEPVPDIAELLLRSGFSDDNVRGMLGGNFMRVARQAWQTPH